MDWIRLDVGFPQHPKVKRTARALGVHLACAIGHLTRLLCWVGQNRENGDLAGLDADDLADICDWPDDPAKLERALVACRWIDQTADTKRLHGWGERQPLLKRREWPSTKRARDEHDTRTRGASTDGRTDIRTDSKAIPRAQAIHEFKALMERAEKLRKIDRLGMRDKDKKKLDDEIANCLVKAEGLRVIAWPDRSEAKTT